jgi:hypothetical protein
LSFYARIIEERASELLQVSKYIVADAFFSRNPFMGRVVAAGFHVITRARKDISLRYYHQVGMGRKRKWDGKVDIRQVHQHLVRLRQAQSPLDFIARQRRKPPCRKSFCWTGFFSTEKGKVREEC